MRTTKTTVTFFAPFSLNKDSGELPEGTYDVDVDEEEIGNGERTAYRRTAIYFHVKKLGTSRMLVIQPSDLEEALKRDAEQRAAPLFQEDDPRNHAEGTSPKGKPAI